MIDYRIGSISDLEVVRELYRASTLAERRPVEDAERFAAMLRHANLVVTAWEDDVLVGIARALSDFGFVTYLSDLAVCASHQRRGIGTELMRRVQAAAPQATLLLLAAPAAEAYYPHVGFTHHPQAWVLRPGENLGSR